MGAGRVRSATQINGRPVGRTLDLTNFSGYYISSKKSWLSIAVNQSALALPVFRTGGVGKFYFPFFFLEKLKKINPLFYLITLIPLILKKQKNSAIFLYGF